MPRVLHHLFLAVYFLFSDFFWGGGGNVIKIQSSRNLGFKGINCSKQASS